MKLTACAKTLNFRVYVPQSRPHLPSSISTALLMGSRWCSNVSTLNARLLNSAPLFTKLSQHALSLGWIHSKSCLLSFVTKVYASAEPQALAMPQVMFPHRQSTQWLVAPSVRRHMSVPARHAVSDTFLLTRTTCQHHYQWLLLLLQAVQT